MSTKSMREQLDEAFDKASGADEEEEIDETVVDGDESEDAGDGQPAKTEDDADKGGEDEGGAGTPEDDSEEDPPVKDDKPPVGKDGPAKKGAEGKDAKGGADKADKSGEQDKGDKPPESWKPAIREHWSKLPPEVRAEVTRREREIQAGLHQAAGARKVAAEYFGVVKPFEALIRAQNSTPAQAITNLMQTASRLTLGTKVSKAEVVAEIIKNYDVDIVALDTLLSGKKPPEEDDKFARMLDARLKPMTDFMGRITSQQETTVQKTEEELGKELETFQNDPKNEFFSDVRDDMADLIEIAAKRGETMTLAQAYKRACSMNEDVSKVVQQRKGALDSTALLKKKRAASSIKGAPDNDEKPKPDGSDLRGSIAAAWNELEEERA